MRSLFGTIALLTLGFGCAPSLPASRPHELLNQSPAPMEQPTLSGDLATFPKQGKVTVIDFWSTSCAPCVKMMPAIQALHSEHEAAGLYVVGVAIDDNPGLVAERLKKMGVTYTNVLDDGASSVRGAYQVTDLPQTFIFDKKGVLRVVTRGGDEADVAKIEDAVEFLLSE